jgi:Uma2 family endonuclease
MATTHLVSVEEYLHTSYEPDAEYVDGRVAPPFLCVEILSPDDTAVAIRAKVEEYFAFGVPYVWVIDPTPRRGEIYTRSGILRVGDGMFQAGDIQVNIREA